MTSNNDTSQPPVVERWEGLTLEQLRYRRALSLVRREMGRASMQNSIDGVRTQVGNNGVRGLLFSSKTNARLKKVDMILLGVKLTRTLYKMWRKMH